ncbi:MAG TPA: universal stress protein [Candidatus Acidoferrum sp.]|nr:universal stress protein [Candidatus Acidoferrum sp.]
MVRKILIAHDLSRRSSVALARAAQLAGQTGAALELLHVVEDDLPAAVIDRRKAEARAVMGDELAALTELARVTVETIVLVGKDYMDILNRAEKAGADLIVLGVHRADALRSIVVGTTAERLIGFGSRPVLVVKTPPVGPYQRAVVAADVSASARSAAAFACDLLPKSEIRLVHAVAMTGDGGQVKAVEKLEGLRSELRAGGGGAPQLLIRHGSPIAVIRDAAEDAEADLLVVGAQRRAGLTRTLIGEIPEDLLARPPCDLLVVHA